MFKMSFLSCSHPFIYGNIKRHLKLRPVFAFLAYLPKLPVTWFHFILCSLSNKCLRWQLSSSIQLLLEECLWKYLARHEQRAGMEQSEASSYTILHPSLELNCFQEKSLFRFDRLYWMLSMGYTIDCQLHWLRRPDGSWEWVGGVAPCTGRSSPPQLVLLCRNSGSRLSNLVFQGKGRSGVLCEISQFLNVGKAVHIF